MVAEEEDKVVEKKVDKEDEKEMDKVVGKKVDKEDEKEMDKVVGKEVDKAVKACAADLCRQD